MCSIVLYGRGIRGDVVASPSPAGGKDSNSASNKVAAVHFYAAVFFSEGASGIVFTTNAFQM